MPNEDVPCVSEKDLRVARMTRELLFHLNVGFDLVELGSDVSSTLRISIRGETMRTGNVLNGTSIGVHVFQAD